MFEWANDTAIIKPAHKKMGSCHIGEQSKLRQAVSQVFAHMIMNREEAAEKDLALFSSCTQALERSQTAGC